jgi:hypothetical protein
MEPDAGETDALLALSEILVEYGNRRTNPVLDVLPENKPFQLNKKYPPQRLHFGADQWRAYYHSHSDQYPSPWDEHGHFHLFYRVDDQGDTATDWSHVVALSMSAEGQPVRWFTVNNWVCGDRWLNAPELENRIRFSADGDVPAGRWLACMTNFYRDRIVELLFSRDRVLDQARHQQSLQDALIDRNIYYLANQAIDLKQELGIALDQRR